MTIVSRLRRSDSSVQCVHVGLNLDDGNSVTSGSGMVVNFVDAEDWLTRSIVPVQAHPQTLRCDVLVSTPPAHVGGTGH